MDTRISLSVLIVIIFSGGIIQAGNFDSGCYPDFPIKDGLLCYPKCKAGFGNYGGGPVCWGTCPEHTTNIGVSCAKDSYGRGVGKPLSTCGAGEEKNGLLCYPKCKSGYYGVGPVCWGSCKAGWQDQGALCAVPLEIYGRDTGSCPWYNKCGLFGANCGGKCKPGYVNDGCTCRRPLQIVAKKSYGRGAGEPMQCASNEEQGGALCYPKCKAGYVGVGPVCWWGTCSGETKDIGAFCQKNSYGRGVGRPLACLTLLSAGYAKKQDVHNLSDYLINSKTKSLSRTVCLDIWSVAKYLMEAFAFIGSCSKQDNWNTIVLSISGRASALLTADGEIGIALDVKNNKAACYLQHCSGFDLRLGVGIAVNLGWYRSLDDIPGQSNSISFGLKLPLPDIDFDTASVKNSKGEHIGTVTSLGLGVGLSPLPFDENGSSCNTPKDEMIYFTPNNMR